MTSFFDADEDIDDYVERINKCATIPDLDQAAWEDDWEDCLPEPPCKSKKKKKKKKPRKKKDTKSKCKPKKRHRRRKPKKKKKCVIL